MPSTTNRACSTCTSGPSAAASPWPARWPWRSPPPACTPPEHRSTTMSTHGIASSGPGEWVLLWYRMPREPSTPRIAIWRKLKRLGVAQLGDGLITLPADARTRGQLDWIARRSPKAVTDPADVATGATAFDMGGVELGLHGGDCSFKTILSCQDLTDPVLWKIAAIVHGADLADERYDAPEAPGLDVVLRGLWMVCGDAEVLALAGAAVRRAVRVRPPRAAAGPRPSMTGIGRMTSRRPRAAAAAAAVVVVMVAGFAWASWRAHAAREDLRDLPLRVVADLPLGGGSSRFDYLSLHPARDRLYLAHLGADLVTVVDVRRRVVLADIAGVPAPPGVLVVPALGRAYASATAAHELVALDAASYRVLARTPAGQFPDGIAYDPATGKLLSPTSRAARRSSSTRQLGSAPARSGLAARPATSPSTRAAGRCWWRCRAAIRSRSSTRAASRSCAGSGWPAVTMTMGCWSTRPPAGVCRLRRQRAAAAG